MGTGPVNNLEIGSVPFRLCLITDGSVGVLGEINQALQAGVRAVQLREKHLSSRALLKLAKELRELTRKHGAKLLINDRLDVALSTESDGLQIPEEGAPVSSIRSFFPSGIIGRSVHSAEGAIQAEKDGVDFVTYSPVFETSSKPGVKPQGLSGLREAASRVGIPVFALGGVTPERAADCLNAGAGGVAVISAILKSTDICATIRRFETALGGL